MFLKIWCSRHILPLIFNYFFVGCGIKNEVPRFFTDAVELRSVNENEWPWFVFIQIGARPNVAARRLSCAGALISTK